MDPVLSLFSLEAGCARPSPADNPPGHKACAKLDKSVYKMWKSTGLRKSKPEMNRLKTD
jgi:hypothetical protein